jgi:nitrate reductase assembly molybdenum cofactor insertion protein NarJ
MSSPLKTLGNHQRVLIEDSARWRLLSMLLECPVDGWCQALTALAAEVPDPDLREAAAAAQAEASEGLYHSLFGPGGPASPREVSYRKGVESGGLLSELTGYYNAFGYDPASLEACDHVAVEAGFVGYLRLKEAYAQACADSEHDELTADAAGHFIQDHISAMAEPLAARLDQAGVHYLALASQALVQSAKQSLRKK